MVASIGFYLLAVKKHTLDVLKFIRKPIRDLKKQD